MLKKTIRENLPAIFVIIILPLIFLYQVLIHPGSVLSPASDVLSAYSPWRNFLVHHFINFKAIPLWNPYEFSGTSFIANVSSGITYPFSIIFFLLPVDFAFGYAFILDFILLGFFTYFFARSIRVGQAGALVASIASTFSGTVFSTIYPGHLFILDTFLWFPLLLYFFEKGLLSKKIIYGLLASIPISLMLLSGNTQVVLYAVFFAFIYIFLRTILSKHKKEAAKFSVTIFLIPLILGISIAAIQVLPSLEFLGVSSRGGGVDFSFASSFSLPPKQIISFILPFFFGSPLDSSFWGRGNFWGLCGYLGVVSLFFAGFSLAIKRNVYAKIFFIFAVFSVSFAFGKYFFVFPFFYNFVPLFNLFRVPARILFFYAFSISILAGIGFDSYISKGKEVVSQDFGRKLKVTILMISGMLMVIAMLSRFVSFDKLFNNFVLRHKYGSEFNHTILYDHAIYSFVVFSVFLFILSIVLYIYPKYLKKNLVVPVIIALLVIELFIFDNQFVGTTSPEEYYKIPEEIKYIKNDKSIFRIYDWNTSVFYLAEREGIENVTGYDPINLAYYKNFFWNLGPHEDNASDSYIQINQLKNFNILRLLNVKYLLSKKEIKNDNLMIAYKKNFYVYKLLNTLPRAYITDINSNESHAFELPKNLVSVTEKEINANELNLNVDLKNPKKLVLSEIWYPGWVAYDNNKEVSIRKFYIFRSINLEKGKHAIRLIYKPISFEVGKWISIISLLILVLAIVINKKISR